MSKVKQLSKHSKLQRKTISMSKKLLDVVFSMDNWENNNGTHS